MQMEKRKKQDEEELFVTASSAPRLMLKKETMSSKSNDNLVGGQYNWFKRKNAYNEDDVDYTNLPEENMVVATWINDMGNSHKEFDVSCCYDLLIQDKILFFVNETILN